MSKRTAQEPTVKRPPTMTVRKIALIRAGKCQIAFPDTCSTIVESGPVASYLMVECGEEYAACKACFKLAIELGVWVEGL
jgi:hypothetical protein